MIFSKDQKELVNDGEVSISASLSHLKQKIIDIELKMQHDEQRIGNLETQLDRIKTVKYDFNLLFTIKKSDDFIGPHVRKFDTN